MNDCIKLARAMGVDPNLFGPMWGNPIFDPFKDANHDYAVLEWMRGPLYERLCKDDPDVVLRNMWVAIDGDGYDRDAKSDYQIGDYARAALKVI